MIPNKSSGRKDDYKLRPFLDVDIESLRETSSLLLKVRVALFRLQLLEWRTLLQT